MLQGAVALVSEEAVDVLSHIAVRARNSSVLLATCRNADMLSKLRGLKGKTISLHGIQVNTLRALPTSSVYAGMPSEASFSQSEVVYTSCQDLKL